MLIISVISRIESAGCSQNLKKIFPLFSSIYLHIVTTSAGVIIRDFKQRERGRQQGRRNL